MVAALRAAESAGARPHFRETGSELLVGVSSIARPLLANTFECLGGSSLLRALPAWSGLLVLNYHRIGTPTPDSPFDHGLWSASEQEFERQVAFLAAHFELVGPEGLEEHFQNGRGRRVMITFDDGYRDNYTAAFPILKRHGAAATFFVSTGFLDRPRVSWWDEISWMARTTRETELQLPLQGTPLPVGREFQPETLVALLRVYKRLPGTAAAGFLDELARVLGTGRAPTTLAQDTWMTWPMLREMAAAGMSFGGHTVNHPVLANLSREDQRTEIAEGRRRLETELGRPIDAFSYPVGGLTSRNDDTVACLRELGFRWAFRYGRGYQPFPVRDRYNLPRVAVEPYVSGATFRSIAVLPQAFA